MPFIAVTLFACALTQPRVGDVQFAEVDGTEMVFIPAGEFGMGSSSDEPHAEMDEQPIHKVYLDSYRIDKTEVTNEMYLACIDAKVFREPAQTEYYLQSEFANHPVFGVSWEEANAYCNWAGRRLPTEAEWEKAARGTDGRIYPWGNESPTDEFSNFDKNTEGTSSVGSFPKSESPYGALDMAGNVWEWTADGYSIDFYIHTPFNNPLSETPVNQRVLRGGNWDSSTDGIRAANRFWGFPQRNDFDGFRCAKSN